MKTAAPVKKNEIYDVQITAHGNDGEGICKIDGFTVFVKNAVVGDEARIKILKVSKAYAFAKIEELTLPSEHRVTPICGAFGRCGGCSMMHIDYGEQLKNKQKRVYDALVRIGGFEDAEVAPVIGMSTPYHYRNKSQLPVGTGKNGEIVTGFFAPRSHNICPIDDCPVSSEVLFAVTAVVKEFMKCYGVNAYNEETHSGIVRHIFVRTAKSGDVMVVLVTNAIRLEHEEELVEMLRERVVGLKSVIRNINTDKTNLILGKNNITLWGADTLTDTIGDLRFEISPLSFYQVNSTQTEILYNTALELAELSKNDNVFDIYCGIGTISLFMAKKAKNVFGVEIVPEAIADAQNNARINGIGNAHFFCGAAEKIVPELYAAGERADVVMLDPPRKGADEVTLSTIIKSAPSRIVYVSCNPETLARDAKFLRESGGYGIKRVQPVDMFPHTGHVETVVLFCKEN